MADLTRKTANLFDVNSKNTANGYINDAQLTSGGNTETWGSAEVSEYIPIKGNTDYTFNGIGSYNSPSYCLYDSDKQYISGQTYNGRSIITFTSPDNARFVRFTHVKAYASAMFVEGSYTTSTMPVFEPYWQHSLRKLTTATDTLTTLPADIYADGNNATVGLKGNTVQNGTPTPSNPVEVNGVGVRTGNLCTGYTTPNSQFNIYIENFKTIIDTVRRFTLSFDSGITYTGNTLYLITDGGNIVVGYVAGKGHVVKSFSFDNTQVEAIKSSNNPYIRLYVNGADMSGNTNVMLNTGSTAMDFEPYGIKIPISSASTTTPVYLGEVESTRRIKKLVLTGEETTWTKASRAKVFYLWQYDDDALNSANIISCMCSHYSAQGNVATVSSVENLKCCFRTTAQTFYIHDDAFESDTDFVTYLQQQYANGTPVTVWYVLATPTTGIVNEPLRKIGDYADTVSGITIPTITGKDSFDVETTLKPSEVELTYTGWHDASVKEWDGSQWQ